MVDGENFNPFFTHPVNNPKVLDDDFS